MIIEKNEILISIFSHSILSITIAYTGFKICLVIPLTHLEGTMSQILYLCLGSYFMTKIAKYFLTFVKIIF